MTLYQRSVQALASLAAEEEQSSASDLLDRGVIVAAQLDEAQNKLVQAFELAAQLAVDPPRADVKAMSKAVAGLEQGLSKWSVKAFQHKSTSTAVEESKNLIRGIERWGGSAWRLALSDLSPILTRATAPELQGNATAVLRVQLAGKRLTSAVAMNPLTDMDRLVEQFGSRDLAEIVEKIREQVATLEQALADLDAQHDAMPETVRTALAAAQTPGGLPLATVTQELLEELRSAGVIDRLTVRPG